MKFGLISGLLWGLNAVVLSIALALAPTMDSTQLSFASAFLHDACCALILLVWMGCQGRLRDTLDALTTRSGRVVMLAALLGGPLGMSGYLTAINNIGPGFTAIISALYPAFGTVLAVLVLKERMKPRQLICLALALAAVMLMGGSSASMQDTGNAFLGIGGALLCVIGWGSEAVILAWGMRDDKVDDQTALQIRETSSALLYAVLAVPLAGAWPAALDLAPTTVMLVLALAACAGVASYMFYYKAINTIGAARGMAVNISYSAWAVVFAFLLVGTVPSVLEIACCIVVMVNTVLSSCSDWSELASFLPARLREKYCAQQADASTVEHI